MMREYDSWKRLEAGCPEHGYDDDEYEEDWYEDWYDEQFGEENEERYEEWKREQYR